MSGSRRRPAVGRCRICGEVAKLTFEHIPPRSAFNENPVRAISLKEWVARDDLDYVGGRIQQRGMGDRVLCGRCNALCGREYVPTYHAWARWGLQMLGVVPQEVRVVILAATVPRPLRFLKQCVAMMMGSNSPDFSDAHPALRKFVLDPGEKSFPDKYDAYLTLYRGPRARSAGVSGKINTNTGDVTVLSEVAFPPFGILFTFASAHENDFGRISHFRLCDSDADATVRFELLVGEGHTPFPGDYRRRAEVDREAAESRAAESPR